MTDAPRWLDREACAAPDDYALTKANKAELREIVLAYRFLALSRGCTAADMAGAEAAALRAARGR